MKIIGIDSNRSSTEQGMGDRYLQLDRYPAPGWDPFFNEVHTHNMSMSKRRVRVEGNYLVVNCALDEIQNQIKELQEQILEATKNFTEYDAQSKREVEAKEAALKEQRKEADNVFNKLKF